MNADTPIKQAFSPVNAIVFFFGLVMAIAGILNSHPTMFGMPKIGPFDPEIIRPIILGASVVIVLLTQPFGRLIQEKYPGLGKAGYMFDVILFAVTAYTLWRFHVDVGIIASGDLFDFELEHPIIAIAGAVCFVILCWRVWGTPLAVCGVVALIYLYTGEWWPWIFEAASTTNSVQSFINTAEDLWFNQGDGVLGGILEILIFTVFPFILLGSMLEKTGGGMSMIKIAVHLTKRFRGGPAHAAILASGLFGTMSGGAVTNVVATGVITIPMIKKRGFHPAFAGGVEATASSAGQIMPPIMGAAALVMADFTGIGYLTIIVAALVPALAYYASLFTSVVFESRRLGVEAVEEVDPELAVNRQDYINLILVLAPIALVIYTLILGFSPAGAGLMGMYILIPLSFLNPEVRQSPAIIITALARGGQTFGNLLMAIAVVGVIVAVLGSTGLPTDFAQVVSGGSGADLFITLVIAALAALMLSMGMPTLPAYLTIILIMGPAMQNLGLSILVAHLFVFYYGVASSITPPVAVAAYAAASISGAPPMQTAVYAMRVGLVKFIVPFIFAYYPVMLIVEESGVPFDAAGFVSIIARTMLVIYLISSTVISFDHRRLPLWETALRLILAALVLFIDPLVHWPAVAVALAYIVWHWKMFAPKAASAA